MSDPNPGLAQRYRLLLLAYPRWHRRLHGADLLTTMLDAASAGHRTAPFTVVLDGLRSRIRVRGVSGYLVATLLSLVAAATLAAFAGWCGWHAATVAPRPTPAQAEALVSPLDPQGQLEVWPHYEGDDGLWISDGGDQGSRSPILTVLGGGFQSSGIYLTYHANGVTTPARPVNCTTDYADAAHRLTTAGWQTHTTPKNRSPNAPAPA